MIDDAVIDDAVIGDAVTGTPPGPLAGRKEWIGLAVLVQRHPAAADPGRVRLRAPAC